MNKNTDLRAIIYTDGSCAPTNPGKAGAGIHGYIYDYNNHEDKTENKPSRFIVTNNGYKDLDSAVNSIKPAEVIKSIEDKRPIGFSFIVNPINYIEGIVSLSHATNNVAELLGALEAVRFIIENREDYPVKHITIFTDSGYAINAFNKIHDSIGQKYNYWYNRPNHTHLREIEAVLKTAMTNNIKVELKWIKGHAGSIGNVKADMMADVGRKLPTDDMSVKIDFYSPKEYYSKLDINSYISDNLNKMIYDKALLSYPYVFGFKRKVDKMVAGKGLKQNSYVMVKSIDDNSKLKLKDISEEANSICKSLIDLAYNKHFKNIERDYKDSKSNLTAMLNLEELIKGDSYSYLNRYGAECAIELSINKMDMSRVKAKITGDVEHHDTIADIYYSPEVEDELSRYYLIQQLTVEPFIDIVMNLDSKTNNEVLDITSFIYKDNKLLLKDEKVKVNTDSINVDLVTGISLPEINLLKKYEKKIESVKLNILQNGRIFVVINLIDVRIVYFNPSTIAYSVSTINPFNSKKSKKK